MVNILTACSLTSSSSLFSVLFTELLQTIMCTSRLLLCDHHVCPKTGRLYHKYYVMLISNHVIMIAATHTGVFSPVCLLTLLTCTTFWKKIPWFNLQPILGYVLSGHLTIHFTLKFWKSCF